MNMKQKPKNPVRFFLTVWMLLAILVLATTDITLLRASDLFTLLPLVSFALVLILHPEFRFSDYFRAENRATAWISAGFTVLSVLMLSIFAQMQGPLFSESGLLETRWRVALLRWVLLAWNYSGYLGAEILSIFGCWFALQRYMLAPRAQAPTLRPEQPRRWRIHRWTWLVAAVGLACLLSVIPGFYDQADTGVIWQQAISGNWTDVHPITFLFFVRLCTLVIRSREMISLVFYLVWVGISNQAILALDDTRPGSGKVYAVLSCVVFYPLFYVQTMIKDVAYAMALLALGLQLIRMLRKERVKALDWLGAGFWSFIAVSFRHDGILPVALTWIGAGIFALVSRKQWVKPLCVTVCGVLAAHLLVTQGLAFGLMKVEKNPAYYGFGTPMALLAAVVESGKPIDAEDKALLEELMPLSDWAAGQKESGYTVDTVSRSWGIPGERINRVDAAMSMQYLRLAVKYLLRYPTVELEAFFRLNSIAWEIARPTDPNAEERMFASDPTRQLTNGNEIERGFRFTGVAALTYRYAWFLQDTPILREICMRGGVALLAALLAGVTLIRKKRAADLIAFLPAAGAFASTFLIICAQDLRYVLPPAGVGAACQRVRVCRRAERSADRCRETEYNLTGRLRRDNKQERIPVRICALLR